MKRFRPTWFAGSVGVAVGLVLFWAVVADAGWISPVFLPSPAAATKSLVRNATDGELLPLVAGTVTHMTLGWLLASLIGVALGAAIGISPMARAYLQPTLEVLRPLPASAVIPVAIALLGLSETMTLTVIAFGALWPMLLATIQGFSSVGPRLYEVGRALCMSRLAVIWKIALPSAMPDILAGLRIGLSVALILAVVCEMMTGSEGLGYWILMAARSFRSADLFAGVILLGAIGVVSAIALELVETRVLRWRARSMRTPQGS